MHRSKKWVILNLYVFHSYVRYMTKNFYDSIRNSQWGNSREKYTQPKEVIPLVMRAIHIKTMMYHFHLSNRQKRKDWYDVVQGRVQLGMGYRGWTVSLFTIGQLKGVWDPDSLQAAISYYIEWEINITICRYAIPSANLLGMIPVQGKQDMPSEALLKDTTARPLNFRTVLITASEVSLWRMYTVHVKFTHRYRKNAHIHE